MHNKSIVVAIVIFVLIIIGMFTFAFLKKSELKVSPVEQIPVTEAGPYDYITRIDAKHFLVDGEHTLVGEILLPTPCDLLNWDTRVDESQLNTVSVDFTVINTTDSCVQTMTPQRFKVSFAGDQTTNIVSSFERRTVELNLIPAGEGETPDDFELFIKG